MRLVCGYPYAFVCPFVVYVGSVLFRCCFCRMEVMCQVAYNFRPSNSITQPFKVDSSRRDLHHIAQHGRILPCFPRFSSRTIKQTAIIFFHKKNGVRQVFAQAGDLAKAQTASLIRDTGRQLLATEVKVSKSEPSFPSTSSM